MLIYESHLPFDILFNAAKMCEMMKYRIMFQYSIKLCLLIYIYTWFITYTTCWQI